MAGDEQARGRRPLALIIGAVVVVAAIVVGEKPLWMGPRDVHWVEARDDVLLFYHGDGNLTLAEAATGTHRWTFEKLHDLGGVGLQQTFHGGPGERHLIGRPSQVLRVVDDRVALVSVTAGPIHPTYAGGTQRTVAIDVRTGAKLWEKADGVWPMWIAGDTALGSHLVDVAGDVALTISGQQPTSLIMVAADTGGELGTFDEADRMENCETDGRTLIACAVTVEETSQARKLATFEVGSRRVGSATPGEATVLSVDAVWDGRILVRGRSGGGSNPRTYTLDAAGNEIDKTLDLPGRLLLLTEKHVVLRVDNGDGVVAVYEVLD